MPQTGSQILAYEGRAGLGYDSDIPAIDPKQNLDIINNTARDVLLLNHANNIKLYEQKIKDRDNTLQLLASGEISSGEIDPNDRPVYDKQKQKVKDSFYEMIRNGGLNNPEAVRKYYDNVSELANVTSHAQSRNLELRKLKTEQSNQVLPDDISMYDTHIKDEYKKDFWQPINPLQKAFHLNLPSMTSSIAGAAQTEGSIGGLDENGMPSNTTQWNTVTDKNGVVTNRTTTKTAPLKSAQLTRAATKNTGSINVKPDGSLSEISYTPEKYWDYPTMLKNAQEQYVSDPTQRENQNQWLQQVTNYDDAQKVKLLQAYNNRIAQYSIERDIQPDKLNADGSPHFPDQINFGADPTGRIQISETPSSFAAKHTLASIEGNYVEKPQAVLNKDVADVNIRKKLANIDAGRLAESIRHNKASEGIDWAKYDLDKDKFNETTKGGTTDKNAALVYATNLLGDLYKVGTKTVDGSGAVILTPKDFRKLTADQLRYLGISKPNTYTGKEVLNPLTIGDNDILQVESDGTIRVMKDATKRKEGGYVGTWDNTKSTSIWNAARNIVNEENEKSGTKERNAYFPIDFKGQQGLVNVDVTGATETKSGSTNNGYNIKAKNTTETELDPNGFKKEGKYWRYKNGTLYNDKGEIVK